MRARGNPRGIRMFERLRLPVDAVIYGQGRVSRRLLEWLSSQQTPFSLLHLPDYDPVGLNEFQRLRKFLGEKAQLHIPADLSQQFSRYSNSAILAKPRSRVLLANLRNSAVPEVRRVLDFIQRHNAGLEQEALLLARAAPAT